MLICVYILRICTLHYFKTSVVQRSAFICRKFWTVLASAVDVSSNIPCVITSVTPVISCAIYLVFLQTKKRYVGYMYESPDQEKPVYDAKGIETVRRDGCPAVAKVIFSYVLNLVSPTQ